MPFVKISGLKGKVYVPEPQPVELKKHPCRDCFSCQMCADSRCSVCLNDKAGKNSCHYAQKPSK